MGSDARHRSELIGPLRREDGHTAPDLRARSATIPIVVGGLAVWGLFLLLML
ncbi:MAG: hypothetical protein IT563_08750 [Alphaproteobacteria bacterium]|nr:hypothetical protein [Alphaproteobacteria bacterium]